MSASIVTYEKEHLVNSEKYIGLDVHQATISVAVMDSNRQGSHGVHPGDQSGDPS